MVNVNRAKTSIFLLLVCTILLFTLCTTAAAEITTDGGTGTTSVTYAPEAKFVVVIPASVSIDSKTSKGTLTLSLGTETIFSNGQHIRVLLTDSTHYIPETNTFRMLYIPDPSDQSTSYSMTYAITDENAKTITIDHTTFLADWTQDAKKDKTLTLTTGKTSVAGSYSDTLTFSISSVIP